jgi:preprotein translocase subunit SecG
MKMEEAGSTPRHSKQQSTIMTIMMMMMIIIIIIIIIIMAVLQQKSTKNFWHNYWRLTQVPARQSCLCASLNKTTRRNMRRNYAHS